MKMTNECLACFTRQARETAERATPDGDVRSEVMRRVAALAKSASPSMCPPEFAERVYDTVAAVTGNPDPFVAEKRLANDMAIGLEPRFRELLSSASDSMRAAIQFSIAGNSMDLGVVREYGDVGALAEAMLTRPLGIDDYWSFQDVLSRAHHVLIVGDNNGEIVFDRLLIEEMMKIRACHYTYVVRGRPVINDVTLEDARSVGIDCVADIVESGCGAPGLLLSSCPANLLAMFQSADMVIAKGQGNYESLSEAPRDVFFLLMVKCDVVARDISAPVGAAVVKHYRP
jgi:damage-control phosphatase, subfamily I